MSKGLSNYQINEFFKGEGNDEMKKNYMQTYSIDSIIKYINFYEIIKKNEMQSIHLLFSILINIMNLVSTGGVF